MLYKLAAHLSNARVKQKHIDLTDWEKLPAKEFYKKLDKTNFTDAQKLELIKANIGYSSRMVKPLDDTRKKIDKIYSKTWLPSFLIPSY